MRFKTWLKKLEEVLQTRFGIGINDTCDHKQSFKRGETPNQVADYIKKKWNLVELKKGE